MTRKRSKGLPSRVKSEAGGAKGPKRKGSGEAQAAEGEHPPFLSAAGMREVVESVVIAFVLAFLFRTFEAEAFVIPTGSMAPTLMGRHKDVSCSECGYPFRVSASDEIDSATNQRKDTTIRGGTCPMCRHTMDFGPGNPQGETYRSYKGDRILVAKFAYRFSDPDRWDVAVFKYPGGAKTNFIKRIVGLPGETIGISGGDLYVRALEKTVEKNDFDRFPTPSHGQGNGPIGLEDFIIARKPPAKIRAMLQPVYDNDRVLEKLIDADWPERWSPEADDDSAGGWETSEDLRSFRTEGEAEGETWIVYRHFVPSYEDWDRVNRGVNFHDATREDPRVEFVFSREDWQAPVEHEECERRCPALITDFSAYNTDLGTRDDLMPTEAMLGLHWVGDLAVECEMEVRSDSGTALFELVEGGTVFRCGIDVSTGKATLSIEGGPEFHSTENTAVRGPGTYTIMFANVDDQLTLWVKKKGWLKNKVVRFEGKGKYGPLDNKRPRAEDRYRPVRIGSRGAALGITHLRIYRDIYYIAERLGNSHRGGALADHDTHEYDLDTRGEVNAALARPLEWACFRSPNQAVFPLGEGRFLLVRRPPRQYGGNGLWNGGADHLIGGTLLSGVPAPEVVNSPAEIVSEKEVHGLLTGPEKWSGLRAKREVAFPLDEDQFLVLGDNSAESKDSRLWESEVLDNNGYVRHYVHRDLLMGKALFVYWPHSLDKIPYTDIPIRFLPNVARMHFVR